MKEIIYLNTDYLHSFMAQTNKGLPTSKTQEQSQQDSQTVTDTTKRTSTHQVQPEVKTGGVSIPFLAVSPSGSLSYQYRNGF